MPEEEKPFSFLDNSERHLRELILTQKNSLIPSQVTIVLGGGVAAHLMSSMGAGSS